MWHPVGGQDLCGALQNITYPALPGFLCALSLDLPSLIVQSVPSPTSAAHSLLGSGSAGGERGPWVQRRCHGVYPCAFRPASLSQSVLRSASCPLGSVCSLGLVSHCQLLLPKLGFLSLQFVTAGPFAFHLLGFVSHLQLFSLIVLFGFVHYFRPFLSSDGSEGHTFDLPCLSRPGGSYLIFMNLVY